MLNIKVICVGRLKEKFYTDAANEYIKRLSAYCKLEVAEIQESAAPRETGDKPREAGDEGTVALGAQLEAALRKEGASIKANIPTGAMTVALCPEGLELDSIKFSKLLTDYAGRGVSRLCFIIGGSNGLDESVKNASGTKLSLSQMTFPHNLARIILLEQLYRALNIAAGGKYHK